MPRRNENAAYHKPKLSWISLLPYDGRIALRGSSKPNVTGESIVREHRQKERQRPVATIQPYRVIPQPHPSFCRKVIDRINWRRAFDLVCGALAAIAIAYILGFIVFGPTKEFWK